MHTHKWEISAYTSSMLNSSEDKQHTRSRTMTKSLTMLARQIISSSSTTIFLSLAKGTELCNRIPKRSQ